jgi:hypothetical protein
LIRLDREERFDVAPKLGVAPAFPIEVGGPLRFGEWQQRYEDLTLSVEATGAHASFPAPKRRESVQYISVHTR